MTKDHRRFSFLAILIVLSAFAFAPVVFAAETDAASAIASAKQQLVVCFQTAVDAEAAGANITQLTHVLTDAGALLSDAELAFANGDFDNAQNLATDSQVGLANFASEANALSVAATEAKNMDFLVNVVGSIVGVIVVIVLGVFGWFFVKKRYAPRGERELGWRQVD